MTRLFIGVSGKAVLYRLSHRAERALMEPPLPPPCLLQRNEQIEPDDEGDDNADQMMKP